MRFPWPMRDPDGEQIWLSELAMAFATEELWETRGNEIESWDIEYAADQVRMFLWNVGLAGALQAAFEAGEQHKTRTLPSVKGMPLRKFTWVINIAEDAAMLWPRIVHKGMHRASRTSSFTRTTRPTSTSRKVRRERP